MKDRLGFWLLVSMAMVLLVVLVLMFSSCTLAGPAIGEWERCFKVPYATSDSTGAIGVYCEADSLFVAEP